MFALRAADHMSDRMGDLLPINLDGHLPFCFIDAMSIGGR